MKMRKNRISTQVFMFENIMFIALKLLYFRRSYDGIIRMSVYLSICYNTAHRRIFVFRERNLFVLVSLLYILF